jgi:hypothetical protein
MFYRITYKIPVTSKNRTNRKTVRSSWVSELRLQELGGIDAAIRTFKPANIYDTDSSFEVCRKHFEGFECGRNYGYGVGFEPIIMGSMYAV